MSKPRKLRTAYITYFEHISDKEFSDWLNITEELGLEVVFNLNEDPDVLFFVDGPPVNPSMYGEKQLPGLNLKIDRERDGMEEYLFHASQNKIPTPLIIGVGNRGANLVNALCGGKSYQHVYGYMGAAHVEYTLREKIIWWINSCTQQVPIPPENGKDKIIPYHILAKKLYIRSSMKFRSNAKHHLKRKTHVQIESIWYPASNALCYLPTLDNHQSKDLFKSIWNDILSGKIASHLTRQENALPELPAWSEEQKKDKRCIGCHSCSKDIECAFFDAKKQGRYPPIELIKEGSRKHTKTHLKLTHQIYNGDVVQGTPMFNHEELKEMPIEGLEELLKRIGHSEKQIENLDWLSTRWLSEVNWSDLVCWGPRLRARVVTTLGIIDNRYHSTRRLWDYRGRVMKMLALKQRLKAVEDVKATADARQPIRLVAVTEPEKLSLSDFKTLGSDFTNPIMLNEYLKRHPQGCACCGETNPFNLRIDEAVVLKGEAPFVCGFCAGSQANFKNYIEPYGVRA